ncbi:hypothetical protein DHEL01_v207911 [Diaporthe helianthi]|uniref:Uncharacterized protein n=1 Tax=Diaporthe helianthi TaxID=158607 RepID=A0A2P5HTX8_DIAHE|nr:hypothetical protein DHEL01_v207911 [Diaporthe helianthi]
MSRFNPPRSSSRVDDWLDSQYEYIAPDKDTNNPYVPRDATTDATLENPDISPPRSKGSHSSKEHKSPRDRYRPVTPPPEEDDLNRERDRHRHKGKSSRSHDGDRESRRSHQDRDTKYPPKSDRGRPRRPAMTDRATSHYVPRKEDSPERRHRRYSLSSSPPRHRGDKSSRHYHRHHEDRSPSPPPRSSRKKDDRDRESRGHHHHGSGGSTKGTRSRRPSVSRSQTSKEPKRPSSSSGGRSFSFWNDPRFMTAAEAALTAGATAAVGLAGQKGGWGGDKGGKVLRAGLGAAALSALKSPAPAPEPAPAPAPEPAAPAEPGHRTKAADAAGKYVADHMPARKSSTRRRHR